MDKAKLIALYDKMLEIRLVEESFVEPITNGEIRCPVHLYSGQEAIAVGVLSELSAQDVIFGNHRSHGHFLAKGGSVDDLIHEVYCRETGSSKGRGGSMHLINPETGFLGSVPIVGGTISLALGAALAAKIRKNNTVAISFFGDGAAGEGVLYESINMAAVHRLPIIFVCENNLYSTHMPIREIRRSNTIAETAAAFQIRTEVVDGNDVEKVNEVGASAIHDCRVGNGPVFLEFLTYRLRGHVGPDDNIQGTHTDIRPQEELKSWQERDPVLRLEKKLIEAHIFSEEEIRDKKKRLQAKIDKIHQEAKQAAFPHPDKLMHYVFR
ncbi:MAG: Acetoin:2,6-dichlorophenolindophenol oxidoreductase subunit alpha [Turneriella sp.]|nr:Acetoin:2,6-dichlorophenolindophenol oxidoreductase subunit alpha [Turneriella sp.]